MISWNHERSLPLTEPNRTKQRKVKSWFSLKKKHSMIHPHTHIHNFPDTIKNEWILEREKKKKKKVTTKSIL